MLTQNMFNVKPKIILGGPGTGKTTKLISILNDEIKLDNPSERIAYVSFTKQAIQSAKDRVSLSDKQTPWFRTLHSMAFRKLGMSRQEVMDSSHYEKLANMLGMRISNFVDLESSANGPDGNKCIGIIEYARNKLLTLEESWNMHNAIGLEWYKLKRFNDTLFNYKKDLQLIDYTDMLEKFVEEGKPLDVDIAFIDEAQDLTPLQWKVSKVAFVNCKKIYVGGDDDQAIYRWSGADVDTFINLKGDVEVLKKSHRQPKEIYKQSTNILKRISKRRDKKYKPSDRDGTVTYHNRIEGIDLSKGTWLLLARNAYLLKHYEMLVREQGYLYSTKGILSFKKSLVRAIINYEKLRKGEKLSGSEINLVLKRLRIKKKLDISREYTAKDIDLPIDKIWHKCFESISLLDRQYMVSCLRRGEDPKKEPRIRIETIHSSKGAEADNVVVMSDISKQSYLGLQTNSDDENRVFYVAITRAINNLHLVLPQTSYFYRF